MDRKYYEAYDERYQQVHREQLQWFSDDPSPIVREIIEKYGIEKEDKLLELGCGEGRDARFLLQEGYNLTATDLSGEAVAYCRKTMPEYAQSFRVLDCITDRTEEKYDFIYAVAVLHMLVEDGDRQGFFRFLRETLADDGYALLCMLGDGEAERSSDVRTAFDLQERIHAQSGRTLMLAGTSCRIVNLHTLHRELEESGLTSVEQGFTVIPEYAIPEVFPQMMYAVVKIKQ